MPDTDVSYIDCLLDARGRMGALWCALEFACINPADLKLWCHKRARYVLPTLELVTFIRGVINGRDALEIGSGNGDLGYMLGIRETDSYIQQKRSDLWARMGQVPTNPPAEVVMCDAMRAVYAYRPQVVVGSWITRKFETGIDVEGVDLQASAFGVREEELLERVETYIHVGNEAIHGKKTLLRKPHETVRVPGHLSRHADQNLNVVYIWNR